MVIAGNGIPGFHDGPGTTARFHCPVDVAVARNGDIFVTEFGGHRVRRICGADHTVTTVAGSNVLGSADGAGYRAQFDTPSAVVVDGRGTLIVADGAWDGFRLRRVAASADHTVTTVVCTMPAGVVPLKIYGIAIDRDGSLLVATPTAHQLFRVTGLGLVPTTTSVWSLRAHRQLATTIPEVGTFVTTVMLCASRIDAESYRPGHAVPRLPTLHWLAILSMLRPDHMLPR